MITNLIKVSEYSPYLISGPAQICFSGGRSSGKMLYEILDANNGLPANSIVTFQNTGKEAPQTLDFVQEVSHHWNVPITWIEWNGFIPPGRNKCMFKLVDYSTASRNGEPFALLIDALGYLPNPTQRLCTANLKVKAGEAFMRSQGYESWDNVMGIRADEPRRLARLRTPGRDNSGGEPVMPLAEAKVTKRMVGDFWRKQPFDLNLHNDNGVTSEGNCDLCFLKGKNQVLSLIRKNPTAAQWWIEQEQKISKIGASGDCARFRKDRPTYKQMLEYSDQQGEMYPFDDEPLVDCMCGD